MHPDQLLDPLSAAVVIGGTLLATVLRCGLADCRIALAALGGLGRRRFDAEATRAVMAAQVRAIHEDGLLRAEPAHFADSEFDEAADALIGTRTIAALHAAHERHQVRRTEQSERAAQVYNQAAELAPVFGLAGTLISLTQLQVNGGSADFTGAIAMAVLTTLYGLLLGNLLCAPLARMIERAARHEERQRQSLIDWLAGEVADEVPGTPDRPRARIAAARA